MCIKEYLSYLFVSETGWKGIFTFATFTEEITSTKDHYVRGVVDYSIKDLTFLFVRVVIWIDTKPWIIFSLNFFLGSGSE